MEVHDTLDRIVQFARLEIKETSVSNKEKSVRNLLWTGEEAMKKVIPILKRAGFESVEDLPRTAVGFSSKTYQDLPP